MSKANNFARIAPAALRGETSRMELLEAIADSVKPFRWQKPDAEGKRAMVPAMLDRFNNAKLEHSIGFIAARCCDGTETERLAKARDVLAMANPDAKGKAPKGRRTEAQQRAYKAANVAWGRIVADIAGLTAPHANAGNTNAKGKAQQPKAKDTPKDAPKEVAAILAAMPEKANDADAVRSHVASQVAAMLAYVNRHAKVADNTTKSFVQDVIDLATKANIRKPAK